MSDKDIDYSEQLDSPFFIISEEVSYPENMDSVVVIETTTITYKKGDIDE